MFISLNWIGSSANVMSLSMRLGWNIAYSIIDLYRYSVNLKTKQVYKTSSKQTENLPNVNEYWIYSSTWRVYKDVSFKTSNFNFWTRRNEKGFHRQKLPWQQECFLLWVHFTCSNGDKLKLPVSDSLYCSLYCYYRFSPSSTTV